MAIRIPYSQMAATNYIPANRTNFPSLKHFWPCLQTEIGATSLTDIVGGVLLTKSSGTIAAPATPDGYSVFPNQAGTGTTKTGTITPPAGKQFILFSVGQFSGSGFVLGDTSSAPVISVLQAGTSNIRDAAARTYSATAYTNSASIYGRALIVTNYNDASGMQSLECDTNATYTAKTATTTANDVALSGIPLSTDGISSLEGGTAKWACASTTTNLYGVALFIFPGAIPADYRSAIAWMTYQWANGNKAIYPGWKGL